MYEEKKACVATHEVLVVTYALDKKGRSIPKHASLISPQRRVCCLLIAVEEFICFQRWPSQACHKLVLSACCLSSGVVSRSCAGKEIVGSKGVAHESDRTQTMESARNEQSNNNNSASGHVALLGDTEQHLGRTMVASDVLGPQHLTGQQSVTSEGGDSSSTIDFLGTRSAPQHQLPLPAHHTIPTIPEDRAATGLAQHPSSDKQNDGCSPDPHSSATTTGTTSTPTSIGNSSSPSPCDSSGPVGKSGSAPDFPSESLGTDRGMHGQGHWPTSLGEGVMAPRYGPPATPDHSQFNVSPPENQRYSSGGFPCAIKLLVSNNVAGSIIGRAGQTISDLQAQSSTRIKLSQTGDYYPGSQDRVCLVQGQLENVKGAVGLLLERLYMLQEHQHSQHMAWQSNRSEGGPPFDFVVRILVPSSSCGMIIGKSGANIRQMEEASGVASVRLSPKDIVDPNYPSATITSATSERVVTLTGPTLECCLNCLFIILDGMTTHPDICRYTNMTTSYSRIMPPDPFAVGQPTMRPGSVDPVLGAEAGLWDSRYAPPPQPGGMGKRVGSAPDLAGSFLGHRSMPMEPRQAQVGAHGNRESLQYSPMFGGGPSSSYSPIRQPVQPRMPPQTSGQPMYLNQPPMEHPVSVASVPSSVSAPDLLALQIGQMELQSSPGGPQTRSPPHVAHPEYPLFPQHQGAGPAQQGFSAQLFVPDNMIGSILGRGGKTLNDLQAQSGTRIRISQRGEYMPGTRNRLVTIRGATPENVNMAQYLMSQRMILPRTATYQPVPISQAPPVPAGYAGDDQTGSGVAYEHLFHPHHAVDPHAPPPPSLHPPHPSQQSLQGPLPSTGAPAPSSSGTDHSTAT
ncbi:RNA-binding protein Nova-1 [Seminavis robusta]|uniref:RNA-binding protein Nova-1 n=1 Tax=Seminavis robusta TaxID=568900 RepID=A0A9N8E8Y8_9STRA|nr:RNA-binding protein Nova-1 [Seminavis robusta]|eukprot:Sro803_g204770.1 RNA-binding protein Nova-1 (852) ;mRNA; f:24797-27781